jgi:hypothetical protein
MGFDDLETLEGAAGRAYAAEFLGFLKVWRNLPDIDGIIANPEGAAVPAIKDMATQYAICCALTVRAGPKTIDPIVKYLSRLPLEIQVFGIRDITRTYPNASSSSEFLAWIKRNQRHLRSSDN